MTAPQEESVPPAVPVPPPSPPVIPVTVSPAPTDVEPRRKLWQALFFTKDGRLDVNQLILLSCCVTGLAVFVGQASGRIPTGRPDKEAWAWFGAFTAFCFGAGAYVNGKAMLSKGSVVNSITHVLGDQRGGALRTGIREAAAVGSPEPDLFTDDESGEEA